jgi:hypothetical protein
MAHWNTQQITEDLKTIVGVIDVVNNGQGGSYDTDNLIIEIGGAEDKLWVCGFNVDDNAIEETSDVDVEFVELTDGLQSDHGLSSSDFKVARMYIDVRQYFINRGFNVVDSMNAYF